MTNKRKISVVIGVVDNSTSYARLKQIIQEADDRIMREGLTGASIEIDITRDYYGHIEDTQLMIYAKRDETDEEYQLRLQQNLTDDQRRIQYLEEELERLKRKK